MRAALLRGREHPELGAVQALAEGCVAIALSRGGAPKRYPHRDPNEDAAGFAFGQAGHFVAVADGHEGAVASEVALLHLLGEPAAQWTEEPGALDATRWPRQLLAALCDANREVRRERVGQPAASSRTTLALALVLPSPGLLLCAAIGDSHVFVVGARGVREVVPAAASLGFLGDAYETPGALAGVVRIGSEPLAGLRALLLATDGLSERGIGVVSPAAAVAEAVRVAEKSRSAAPALVAARSLTEAALEAHRRNRAGDNVATAVWWGSE